MIKQNNKTDRILFIDIAKFYGLVLVYYGHIVEQVMYQYNHAAFYHFKFIYSFHMPLFFLLAGYIFKDERLALGSFLKQRFASRFIPLIFFNVLLILLTLVFTAGVSFVDLTSAKGYEQGIMATLLGFPVFNGPTWFLFCLFTVEIIHFFVSPYLTTIKKILIVAACFYFGGWLLNSKVQIFGFPRMIAFWFIHEAVVVYAFYLLGIALRKWGYFERTPSLFYAGVGSVAGLLFVYFTYDLNQGSFRFIQAVIILISNHGHILLFPATAIVGSLFIIFLAQLGPTYKIFLLIGQNALIFFCLNGIFYHFVNTRAAHWMAMNLPSSPWIVFGFCSVVTVASMALCIPAMFLFNKYIPQLVGKPKIKGPLFKNFI